MASKDTPNSELREEAGSAASSAARLQDLLRKDRTLGRIIASNPSASQTLLNELALKHPTEVLANPVLALRALETGGVYANFSLRALVSLCIACDPQQNADLPKEIKERISRAIDAFCAHEEASLSCTWLYQRELTLSPDDLAGSLPYPLEFCIEHRALGIDGSGPISIDPSLHDLRINKSTGGFGGERSALIDFLSSLRDSTINTYIDDSEINRDHSGWSETVVRADNLPEGWHLEGTSLYSGSTEDEDDPQLICEFAAGWYGGGNGPVRIDGNEVIIPIDYKGEIDVEYDLDMGELKDLVGLKLKPDGIKPCDWPKRLAALLIP